MDRQTDQEYFNVFREKVAENYKHGTYRYGFLDNISLVGTVSEESGGYIPDVLDMLEECPFLRLVRDPFLCCYPLLNPGSGASSLPLTKLPLD
jgi:hypothetical protein